MISLPLLVLNSTFPTDNGSCAKQKLQTLWEMLTSWLQPEKRSKEQFLKTVHDKDKFAVKDKWESSGRNMGKLTEKLTNA